MVAQQRDVGLAATSFTFLGEKCMSLSAGRGAGTRVRASHRGPARPWCPPRGDTRRLDGVRVALPGGGAAHALHFPRPTAPLGSPLHRHNAVWCSCPRWFASTFSPGPSHARCAVPPSPVSPGRAGPHRAQRSARVPSPGGSGCALSAPAPRARTYHPPNGGPAGTVCVTGAAGSLARAPAGVCVARFSAMLVMVMHPQVRGAPALRPGTVLLSIRGPLSRGVPPTLARPTECIGGKKVAHSQSLLGGPPGTQKYPGPPLVIRQ